MIGRRYVYARAIFYNMTYLNVVCRQDLLKNTRGTPYTNKARPNSPFRNVALRRRCFVTLDLLQVVGDGGAVTGLLNIAKCLYDAIHRLEKKATRAEEQGGASETQDLAASLLKVRWSLSDDGSNASFLAPSILGLGRSVVRGVAAGERGREQHLPER